MAKTRIKVSGPLFDGHAAQAARQFTDAVAADIGAIGENWIKVEASAFDKSGRGGTGAAAAAVELVHDGGRYTIRGGTRVGEYAWPWLEGTSQRNQTTQFRGYGTFRRTRLRLRRQASGRAQELLSGYIGQMGGTAS